MSSSNLYRLSGLALILGSLIMSVSSGFRTASDGGGSVWWLLTMIGGVFTLLGLPAAYAHQAHRAGKLGLVGFILTFVGIATLEVGSAVLTTPQWAQIGTGFTIVFAAGMIGLNIGLILFGIATFRARVYPRWAGLMMIVGVPAIYILGSLPGVNAKPEVIIFLGLAWCGWVLMRGSKPSMLPVIEPIPQAA